MSYRGKWLLGLTLTSSLLVLGILIFFIVNHGTTIKQVVRMDNAMEMAPHENDSVTVDIIKANTWRLAKKSHIDQHSHHVWKLKSGNYVIRFNYVPENKYFKWNEGERVPNELILELLSIDEMIHETYNLHKERQK